MSMCNMVLHYAPCDIAVCVVRCAHGHFIQAKKIDVIQVSKRSRMQTNSVHLFMCILSEEATIVHGILPNYRHKHLSLCRTEKLVWIESSVCRTGAFLRPQP